MSQEVTAYRKHMNLKLAASELGIAWQTLYTRLRKLGEPVAGDKLRYGTDRDRLGAMGEAEFKRLVPFAADNNTRQFQAKYDFIVSGWKVDVKASLPRQLNKRYAAKSWSFSFKKQSLICDFICCFCFDESKANPRVLLVPSEFFEGLQTISVSCAGGSKWLDYEVKADELAPFFAGLSLNKEAA
jgi:hypothetical protein